MSPHNKQCSDALALVRSVDPPAPDQLTVAESLDLVWPAAPADAPASEKLRAHRERVRGCVALTIESADYHRSLATAEQRALPIVGDSIPTPPQLHAPDLRVFDLALAQARDALHADPLWRAASLYAADRAAESPHRETCLAWKAYLEAPLRQLVTERAAAQALSPGVARQPAPDPSASRAALERFAIAANEAARHDAAPDHEAPAFVRVARTEDRHLELEPVLVRQLAGSEVQLLRPRSGDQTLVLAYTRDLRTSPTSSRSLRLTQSYGQDRTPRRSRSHGVER